MYGYESSENLAAGNGNSSIKFGLNSGAVLTKFEYNANAGAEGAAQDAVDITVNVNGKEFRQRFFPIVKVWREGRDANGVQLQGEITDTTSDEYKEAFARDVKRLNAILTDYAKCFVSEEQLQAALSTPITGFKDFVLILERLIKANPEWDKQSLDVFLQYQWEPRGDNDKTYLELPGTGSKPKAIKQGKFVCKTPEGTYVQDPLSTGIKYTTSEGIEHPFVRTAWFKESDYAKPTIVGSATTAPDMSGGSQAGSNLGGW